MKKVDWILLIEDNKTTSYINERVISKLNIAQKVQVAENGRAALQSLELDCQNGHAVPDLILLDHKMPVMDGFEFFQEYSKLPLPGKKSILVMLTTSMHQQLVNDAKNVGLHEVLAKPLTPDKLASIWQKYFPVEEENIAG